MKKTIILLFLIIDTLPSTCDVIFYPSRFPGLRYSAELIYSFEKINKSKKTTNCWVGFGYTGSFQYTYLHTFGAEFAVEKRHYFQADKFRNFFISAYFGSAFITDFIDEPIIGLVPGFKINYKAQVSSRFIVEPYLSLSLPITLKFDTHPSEPLVFPALTIGTRFGLSKLKNDNKTKT